VAKKSEVSNTAAVVQGVGDDGDRKTCTRWRKRERQGKAEIS